MCTTTSRKVPVGAGLWSRPASGRARTRSFCGLCTRTRIPLKPTALLVGWRAARGSFPGPAARASFPVTRLGHHVLWCCAVLRHGGLGTLRADRESARRVPVPRAPTCSGVAPSAASCSFRRVSCSRHPDSLADDVCVLSVCILNSFVLYWAHVRPPPPRCSATLPHLPRRRVFPLLRRSSPSPGSVSHRRRDSACQHTVQR